ncbi:hypothetical protein [Anaerococcus porci]|uniref:hypothetical protein n=1 Tax=Anaerococcus porci TaxID=2652269 RepID=UPI002A75F5E9|nr:hypothetical protein [Anaerococcus porci]MDY3007086.1 hypothetical protein [Anaerococcus porci]
MPKLFDKKYFNAEVFEKYVDIIERERTNSINRKNITVLVKYFNKMGCCKIMNSKVESLQVTFRQFEYSLSAYRVQIVVEELVIILERLIYSAIVHRTIDKIY